MPFSWGPDNSKLKLPPLCPPPLLAARVLEADAQDELAAGAPQPPLVPPPTDDIADLHD
eukprot:CAMPEP_0181206952 /NCGR_PEP_ID=MMETSP1096-20121128/21312_1 /TAXON_ID=156174 ORGANISM="Chrysochromulina ericina, Strain CCMP281" /NCGR_SAMPLE_ID=MMETSP1096 /ASSEMBLY_ACC=CAM_ASM_000453 /LENGTH=58 /DNA_ID=CAMNT_0023297891 /DNA_START=580 /DNA_END=756 /DNA_ORIENTATION=-